MVYRLRPLVDGFVSLTLSDRDLEVVEAAGVRHGSPVRSGADPWLHVTSEDNDDGAYQECDLPHLLAGMFVMSRHAAAILVPVLGGSGQPIRLGNGDAYVLWNCTRVVDCVDRARTKGAWFPGTDRYMRVKRYVFDAARVEDAAMFRVPEFPADLFVTRPVVDAVVENGLQGYAFDVVPLSQEGAGSPDPVA